MVGRKLAGRDASSAGTFVLELLIWGLGTPRVSCTAYLLRGRTKECVCSGGMGVA